MGTPLRTGATWRRSNAVASPRKGASLVTGVLEGERGRCQYVVDREPRSALRNGRTGEEMRIRQLGVQVPPDVPVQLPPRLHSDVAGGRRERGADQSAAGVVDAIGIARAPEHVEVDVGRESPAQLEIEPRMDVRKVHRADRRTTERDRTGV